MTFDLAKFREKLLSFVKSEEGEDFTPSLVLSELIKFDDVKKLFEAKGFKAEVVEKMINLERQQLIQKKSRKKASETDNADETPDTDSFERMRMLSRSGQNTTLHKTEGVELLIDSVKLRQIAENKSEVNASDVLREMFLQSPPEQGASVLPRNMRAMLSGMVEMDIPEIEYKLRTFEILGIEPETLFPDIKEKRNSMLRDHAQEGGARAGDFLAALITRVQERHPELADKAAKMLGGLGGDTEKKHPRIA